MKNFTTYIFENTNNYSKVFAELTSEIVKTINSEDEEDIRNWINDFLNNEPNTVIDSLVNDSDIYDFYLKYQNDVDNILNENDWFDKVEKTNSLYDIIIKGTTDSIKMFILALKETDENF